MLATAALAPAARGLVACGEESAGPEASGGGQGGTTNQQGTSAPQQPREVTLDELNNNPGRFVGQKVNVSGEVQQVVVAPGAFTVGSTGDENTAVVVLPTKKANVPSNRLSEGDTVRVQGTVRPVSARISQDDDFLFEDQEGFNEEEELFQELQNRVAIAASRVDARIPEEERAVRGKGGRELEPVERADSERLGGPVGLDHSTLRAGSLVLLFDLRRRGQDLYRHRRHDPLLHRR